MIMICIGCIVSLLVFIGMGFKFNKVSQNGRVKTELGWACNKKQFAALIGLVFVALSCVSSVPTGHTGIVTTFGKVEEQTYEAGVHFKLPWQEVICMDNRNQKGTLEMSCFSSDIQEVSVSYSINYQIEKANAQTIYRTIGVSYYDTVMVPRIQEAVKSVIAQYTADELVENRNELSTRVMEILTNDLAGYNIQVVSTAVENIDFTDAFTAAVEAKQVAAQNKLQAEIAQEQAVMEAKAEAQVAQIQAEAELEVAKIHADAEAYAGEKEAAKNQAINESLTEELLQYYLIEGWDGKLPETYVGQGDLLSILDIGSLPKGGN